jgi:O-antigen/teichoic acid export membrane protein
MRLKGLWSNTFLRNNAILFAGALLTGALNYLYYPVLGRLLTPASFGEVQTLISIFLQTTIFLGTMGLVTVGVVANHKDPAEQQELISELERFTFYIAGAVFILVLLLSLPLKHFFKFESAWPFVIVAATVVMGVPVAFRSAYLQAKQRFLNVTLTSQISAGVKLIASAVLVVLGLKTIGAIAGLLVAGVAAFLFVSRKAAKYGWKAPHALREIRLPHLGLIKPELAHGLFVFIVSFSLTVLFSVDILVAKHFFSPTTAGLYAGISTVARIVYFLTGSINQVLLPSIKPYAEKGENEWILLRSLVLLLLLGGSAVFIFWLAPSWIVSTLVGAKYLPYAHLLPTLGLAMLCMNISSLFYYYYIGLRRRVVAVIAPLGVIATVVLLVLSHATPAALVQSLLLGSFTAMVLITVGGAGLSYLRRGSYA